MAIKSLMVWGMCGIAAAVLFMTIPAVYSGQGQRPAQHNAAETKIAYQAISFDEAIRRVQEKSGGRILSAEIKNRDGRVFYRIKVLTPDGQVRIYWVDAETGQII